MWEAYKTYSEQCGVDYDDDFIRETIERTYQIAHGRIESFYPDATVRLPDFVVPNGKSADETLRELCVEGLEQKGLAVDAAGARRARA